jgi:mono/diheme cytochrome c family protein
MKAQRFMAVALAGAAVVVGIAGCGSDSTTSDASTPAASTPTPAATTPAAPAAGDPTAGKGVFTSNCGGCHTLADAGTAGAVGPNLDDLAPDVPQVVSQVTNGGGSMPAFADKLSEQQIQDVAAYVADSTG